MRAAREVEWAIGWQDLPWDWRSEIVHTDEQMHREYQTTVTRPRNFKECPAGCKLCVELQADSDSSEDIDFSMGE